MRSALPTSGPCRAFLLCVLNNKNLVPISVRNSLLIKFSSPKLQLSRKLPQKARQRNTVVVFFQLQFKIHNPKMYKALVVLKFFGQIAAHNLNYTMIGLLTTQNLENHRMFLIQLKFEITLKHDRNRDYLLLRDRPAPTNSLLLTLFIVYHLIYLIHCSYSNPSQSYISSTIVLIPPGTQLKFHKNSAKFFTKKQQIFSFSWLRSHFFSFLRAVPSLAPPEKQNSL